VPDPREGGTIIGTTNRADPSTGREKSGWQHGPVARTKAFWTASATRISGSDQFVVMARSAFRSSFSRWGVDIGVPKTIDNDLSETDFTFGFMDRWDVATDAVDKTCDHRASHTGY
jgi:6-phosphofructokinase 1